MKLSILICSLHKRKAQLKSLLNDLYVQILTNDLMVEVEVLTEIDNKEITTGDKRNRLLKKAQGEYVCFIDDDDHIYPDYLRLINKALETNPDCVGMWGHYSINGGNKTLWKLSRDYEDHDRVEDGQMVLFRRVNHLSPVKRALALEAGFPDKSNAEDKWYSERVAKLVHTEVMINEPIYHYDYQSFSKEYH